jgi:hypothetical protein
MRVFVWVEKQFSRGDAGETGLKLHFTDPRVLPDEIARSISAGLNLSARS